MASRVSKNSGESWFDRYSPVATDSVLVIVCVPIVIVAYEVSVVAGSCVVKVISWVDV